MRRILPVLVLALTACVNDLRVPSILRAQEPPDPKPEALPKVHQDPLPALRVFECDGDHCHQIYRVSADLGGTFFLEGEQEPDMVMTFAEEKAIDLYSPAGPPMRKQVDGGTILVTPFTYVHRLGKPGVFHVVLRRTKCGGQVCDYLAQDKPPPADQVAEFWVSAQKADYPPPKKPKPPKRPR